MMEKIYHCFRCQKKNKEEDLKRLKYRVPKDYKTMEMIDRYKYVCPRCERGEFVIFEDVKND